jgi:hypothetical protein
MTILLRRTALRMLSALQSHHRLSSKYGLPSIGYLTSYRISGSVPLIAKMFTISIEPHLNRLAKLMHLRSVGSSLYASAVLGFSMMKQIRGSVLSHIHFSVYR